MMETAHAEQIAGMRERLGKQNQLIASLWAEVNGKANGKSSKTAVLEELRWDSKMLRAEVKTKPSCAYLSLFY